MERLMLTALLITPWLTGCDGASSKDGDETDTPAVDDTDVDPEPPGPPLPTETFVHPPELQPDANGVYTLEFGPWEVELDGRRFCLRAYNGTVPAPTIRVPAGDDRRVHVNLYNRFQRPDYRYIAGMEGAAEASCHDFNETNLHLHGSHIRPDHSAFDPADPCTGQGCGPDQRYHGDNVLLSVEVTQQARYRWDLDEDGVHHEGTNWYHPHIHGNTAMQVTNGSAGMFVIEGPVDALPGIADARERLMVFNQIPIDDDRVEPLEDGEACTEATLSVNNFLAVTTYMPSLINGVRKPVLVTPPSQVERWRFLHAGNPDELALTLHEALDPDCAAWKVPAAVDFTQIARDGLTLTQWFTTDTVWMSPGYRVDAMVKMPDADVTLCLVERRVRDLNGTAVAVVHVDARAGDPTETALPEEAAVGAHSLPTTYRARLGGGPEVEVSCENTAARPYDQRVVLLVPEGESFHDHAIDEDLFGTSCVPEDGGHGGHGGGGEDPNPLLPGDQGVCECPSPNINCRNFDDRRAWGYRADRVMTVNTAEKWEVTAFDGHPFHIHINPFLVCPTNSNKEPPFAHWRDTYWVQLEDGPRQILTHFKTFTGQFVLHCHKLNHEDEGMMELVEVCEDGDADCLCLDDAPIGECTPMSGCLDDDLQCQFAAAATAAYPAPPPPDPAVCGDPGPPFP
jgi:FtsP/CotA-like multicopper oxidase with cupredoxin domain